MLATVLATVLVNWQWGDKLPRRLYVAAIAGVVVLSTLLVGIWTWPRMPPSCGSTIQILLVEIPDKHDECGRDVIRRFLLSVPAIVMLLVCVLVVRRARDSN